MELERDQAGSPPAEQDTSGAIVGSPPADQYQDVDSGAPSAPQTDDNSDLAEIVDEREEFSRGLMEAITEAGNPEPDESEGDEEAPPEGEQATQKTEEQTAEAEGEGEEQTDENLPFNKHPRFRQLIQERNEYRNMAEEYRPVADEYRKIESYMASNNLLPQEVAQGFEIMALIKNDPFTARQRLVQYVQMLDQVTGDGPLPNDLRAEVEQGYITEQRARELAQMRHRQQYTQARSQMDLQRQQAEAQRQMAMQQQQAHQQLFEAQKGAVSTWEADIRAKDPDYSRIQPWVFKELRLLSQDSPPRSPQEAVALAQQAYKSVKDGLRRLNPQRSGTLPTARSEQSASGGSAGPQPSSMLEAIMQAAGQ